MTKRKTKWQEALDAMTPSNRAGMLNLARRLRRENLEIVLQSGRKASVDRKTVLAYLKAAA